MVESADYFPYLSYYPNRYDEKIIEAVPDRVYFHVPVDPKGYPKTVIHTNIAINGSMTNVDHMWMTLGSGSRDDAKKELEAIITACQYIIQEYYSE